MGLGGIRDQWQAALLAAATWLVSIGFAVVFDRAGKRGPAEQLLRALAYRGGSPPASRAASSSLGR
ncbi:DUF418 domain-containing protein [Pseudonocardia yunnanensis]|uniref:DUF418 domain-containing protein n=1 Tax=Pseudonocardia yunnanensis TaxID=58107 RepID=A0ABW4ERB4_9PSEU